jgi:hypothetical protein
LKRLLLEKSIEIEISRKGKEDKTKNNNNKFNNK